MLQEKKWNLKSSRSGSKQADSKDSEEEESNSLGDSGEDVYARRSRRHHAPYDQSYNDIKVDIPEFEGQLDSNLFLDWLQTVERVSEFKDIREEKKVKLVALKLRNYASIW